MLARVGARRWIGGIMITWGLIASAMMLMRGVGIFYALRALLAFALLMLAGAALALALCRAPALRAPSPAR